MTDVIIDTRSPVAAVPLARYTVLLTDGDGEPVVGYLDGTPIRARYEGKLDGDGEATITLPPNADVLPANSYFTVTVHTPDHLDDDVDLLIEVPDSETAVTLYSCLVETPAAFGATQRFDPTGAEDLDTMVYDAGTDSWGPGPSAAADVAAAEVAATAAAGSASTAATSAGTAATQATAAAGSASAAATSAGTAATQATASAASASAAATSAGTAATEAAAAASSAAAAEAAAASEVNTLISDLDDADAPTVDDYLALQQDGVLKRVPVADIISVAPAAHTSDTFNRDDNASSLGTTDLGVSGAMGTALVWQQTGGSGAWGISSNRPVRSTSGQRYAYVTTPSADHGAKVTMVNGGGNAGTVGSDKVRLVARFTSSTLHYLAYFVSGGGWRLARIDGSTQNLSTYYTGTVADGDTLELRATGTTIALLHNGAVVRSVDQATYIGTQPAMGTATACGFASGTESTAYVDDFVAMSQDATTFPDVVEDLEQLRSDHDALETVVDGLAVTATRSDWVDPLTGLVYMGVIYADPTTGHGDAIQDAIDEAAAVSGVDKDNRMMVLVPPGTYARSSGTDRITMATGVDVRGATGDPADVIVTSSVDNDTFEAGGKHCLLGFMTISHTGAFTSYAVHVDTLAAVGFAPELVMVSLVLSSASKQACGIGTRRDQHIYAFDCSFAMSNASFDTSALYLHNDTGGTGPAIASFVDCTAISSGNGSSSDGFSIEQYDSGQADEVHWLGGTLLRGNVAAKDLVVFTNGGGSSSYIACRIDTTAYTSSGVAGAGDLDDVAWPVPTPTRLPARRYS